MKFIGGRFAVAIQERIATHAERGSQSNHCRPRRLAVPLLQLGQAVQVQARALGELRLRETGRLPQLPDPDGKPRAFLLAHNPPPEW
jgi:hypothetical protein